MGSILSKIADDIEEYHSLCDFFNKKPKGQIDYRHFTKLKKKMDKHRKKENQDE